MGFPMSLTSTKQTRMRFKALSLYGVAASLCTLMWISCAKQQPTDEVRTLQTSLAFLENGKTTKERLRARLGPPTGEFNQGNIWTYNGLQDAYHLVVVFGEQDIVKTHRVLKVK